MKLPHFKKKYFAGAAAAGLAMGAGGFAAAYFTATGTGSGKASVGSATPFMVTQLSTNPNPLYPGQHQTLTFTVRNVGGGIQHYNIGASDVAVAKNATGTIITANTGKAVPGCEASWFSPSVTPINGTLTPTYNVEFAAKVTMTNGTGTTQNACQTTFPKLTVAFGGPAGFALFEGEGGTASWNGTSEAVLHFPTKGTPGGASAGISVLSPGTTVSNTMAQPTFTTTAYNAGSPRWDIIFKTGAIAFGYPSTTHGGNVATGSNWTLKTKGANGYTSVVASGSWTAVRTAAQSLGNVTSVFIVMDTDQAPGTTSNITNVTYNGQGF